MIELHYWTTPNGHKVTIFLEETGLAYIYARAKEINPNPPGKHTVEQRAILFGQTAASVKAAVR